MRTVFFYKKRIFFILLAGCLCLTSVCFSCGQASAKKNQEDFEVLPDASDTLMEDEASLEEEVVFFSGKKYVADSLNGVSAIYRSSTSSSTDGSNMTYSCAAYIKKYYSKVYGYELNNLYCGSVPNVVNSDDYFVRVKKPKVGDVVSFPSHWAIVKYIDKDGTVTLIEQNYKWFQDGSAACRINRKISKSSAVFYRLNSLIKK